MAITNVTERTSHTYKYTLDDGQPMPTQDLERRFWVYSDSVDENPNTIRTASYGGLSIPAFGAAHPTITVALAQDFDISRDEDYPKRWEVRVTYKSRKVQGGSGGDNNTFNQDPELITKIRVSTVSGERLVTQDINGFPPQTTAGELLTGLKIPWNELQMEFTQYRSVLDTAAYLQLAAYRNAVNSAPWRGFPPLTARISGIEAQEVDIQGDRYLERKITVLLRDPNDTQNPDWRLTFLNAGYYYKREFAAGGDYDPVTGPTMTSRLEKIKDPSTGTFATKPMALSQSGTHLVDPLDPYWLHIEVYPALPFAALNI